MPDNSPRLLTVAVTSRALFDLEESHALWQAEGLDAYAAYQRAHEDDVLGPGVAFTVVRKLLALNPHVKFFDSRQRGYVSVEVEAHKMLTNLRVITDPRDPAATVSTLKSFVVESGRAGAIEV